MKKTLTLFVILLFCITLSACSVQKQHSNKTVSINKTSQEKTTTHTQSGSIYTFIEQEIEKHEDCQRNEYLEKLFVRYAILGTGTSLSGNIEYYILASGGGKYIDKRGNISDSCGFGGIPTTLEIKKSPEMGYELVKYTTAKDGSDYISSTKAMFSTNAFNKRQKKEYTYNNEESVLKRAEKYFGVNFLESGDFVCKICDKKRYYDRYVDNKETNEMYSIYYDDIKKKSDKTKKERYIIFNNNGIFEAVNSRNEGTGTWIFGKDENTIIVDDNYSSHTYDRYIIQSLSGDTLHLMREIIHK